MGSAGRHLQRIPRLLGRHDMQLDESGSQLPRFATDWQEGQPSHETPTLGLASKLPGGQLVLGCRRSPHGKMFALVVPPLTSFQPPGQSPRVRAAVLVRGDDVRVQVEGRLSHGKPLSFIIFLTLPVRKQTGERPA